MINIVLNWHLNYLHKSYFVVKTFKIVGFQNQLFEHKMLTCFLLDRKKTLKMQQTFSNVFIQRNIWYKKEKSNKWYYI